MMSKLWSKFLPFGEALAAARLLRLATQVEWQAWCKEGMRPTYLPVNPHRTYKDHGWQGWVHWLGSSGVRRTNFAPFGEALAVARSLNLASSAEWCQWCKEGTRPPNVPASPDRFYKDAGWRGWGHWLGTGHQQSKDFLPFGDALRVARCLLLASSKEWRVWSREGLRPPNVPGAPNRFYKDAGWRGWGHWLGTGNTANTTPFLPFAEALAVARSHGLASQPQWMAWSKSGTRPPNVPAQPGRTYKDLGWRGWGHWLGTGTQKHQTKEFLPFEQALPVAWSAGLASKTEWAAWCKQGRRPANVPSNPDRVYKDSGWLWWGHWLGTGNGANNKKDFLPFDEALRAARSLRLVSVEEWKAWCKSGARPANVPAAPDQAYVHDGWMGWKHWLRHTDPGAAPAATKRAAAGPASAVAERTGKRRRR